MKITTIQIPCLAAAFLIALALQLQTAHAQEQKPQDQITVTGKLSRVMAIGGESTGWSIHLDHPTTFQGKDVDSLEIDYVKTKKLEKLADKEVKASGRLTHRHGVETGDRLILTVDSIQEIKQTNSQ